MPEPFADAQDLDILSGSAVRGLIAPHGDLVTTAGVGDRLVASDDDMKAINKLARRTLSPEDVYVFDATPSNNALDAYYTRMDKSSLTNYVKDARAGVAIMNSHRTGGRFGIELPIGRSFRAELVQDGEQTTFRSSAYLLRGVRISDVSNDDLIAGIEAGTIFDISIGFRGGWFKCGVCNRNLWDMDCPHLPGWPIDESGKDLAWAWVMDANLGEYSLVYDGATPGAAITKASRMLADGRLSPSQVDEVEHRLGVRLRPATTVVLPGKTQRVDPPVVVTERTEEMTGAELIDAVLAQAGDGLSDASRNHLQTLGRAAGDDLNAAADSLAEFVRGLAGNDGKVTELTAKVAELEPLADDGRAYRAQLVTDTLAMGVRAQGETFRKEFYERLLKEPTRSLEDIRTIHDGFAEQARQQLAGGRRTGQPDINDPSGLLAAVGDADTEPKRNLSQYSA